MLVDGVPPRNVTRLSDARIAIELWPHNDTAYVNITLRNTDGGFLLLQDAVFFTTDCPFEGIWWFDRCCQSYQLIAFVCLSVCRHVRPWVRVCAVSRRRCVPRRLSLVARHWLVAFRWSPAFIYQIVGVVVLVPPLLG